MDNAEESAKTRQINYPEIMNIAEAAMYLTISKYFLYTLVKGGFVPYGKIGKRLVFRRQDLYEWIGRSVVEPTHSMDSDLEENFEE